MDEAVPHGERLAGQTAWVSGGASGIGEAVAELFAQEGASVVIVDVQGEAARRVAEGITARGGNAVSIECDVAVETQIQQSMAMTVERFGGVQIIVNCAGIADVCPLDRYSEQAWDRTMGVNVKSVFFSVKYGVAHLRRNKRSYVVNIGSISSFVGQAQTPAYTASKHAVLGLSRSIALDYAADGIRCNCICPGITDTPLLRMHLASTPDPEATLSRRLRRVPMGIACTPTDIAKAALYLSCEDSSGITGTSLVVDCGYLTAAEWENRDA